MSTDSIKDPEPHILFVLDSDQDTELIRQGFRSWNKKYRLSFTQTLPGAREIIATDPPVIIYIDDGLLNDEEQLPLFPDPVLQTCPVQILISQGEKRSSSHLLVTGEPDYLIKSDPMLREIPQFCEQRLREWQAARDRVASELEHARQIAALQARLDGISRDQALVQQSEERFRFILDATNEGIWDYNIPMNEAFMSSRFYTLLGYDPADIPIPSQNFRLSLIHPDDIGRFHEKLQECLDKKIDQYTIESRMRTKQGTWKWIRTRGKVIGWDEAGIPVRIVGTHADITEQKKIEENLAHEHEKLVASYDLILQSEEELKQNLHDLRQSEQRLRISETRRIMAQQISKTGYWEYYADSGRLWASAEARRLFGYNPVDGDIPLEVVKKSIPDSKPVLQALEDLITDGRAYNLVFEIHPVDGSAPKYVHSMAEIQRDDQGHPLKVLGVIQDITELKKSEEDLRETNAYLENLIESANVPIIVWDPSFRITRFNRAFELLTGRCAADMIGHSLDLLFPPAEVDRSMRLIRTTLDGVRWETVEIGIQHLDGSIRTVLWNSSTVYSADGARPVATIAQGIDVTARNKFERERDTALEQVKQNLAQLAILNDGIRNPLTVITLYADFLADKDLADKFLFQAREIDAIVHQLDVRWLESDKILAYLRKHHKVSIDSSSPYPDEKIASVPPVAQPGSKSPVMVEEVQAGLYTILDSIDAIVYVADMYTHTLLFMNRQGRILFGNRPGKKCFELLQHEQQGPCPFCTNRYLMDESGPTGVYQWEFQNTKNGRWYDCRDRAIHWVDGRIVRVEIATDITERKQTESSLRESEERYRQLVQHIPDYILVHRNGQILFVNDTAATSIGYTLDEVIGTSILTYLTPESQKTVREMMNERMSGSDIPPYEITLVSKDGSERIVEVHGVLIQYGGSMASLNVLTDITERKKIEIALRESEERYRAIVAAIPDVFFIINRQGIFLGYQAKDTSQLLLRPDDFLGKSMHDVIPKPIADLAMQAIVLALDTDQTQVIEYHLDLPDGRTWFEMRIARSSDDVVLAILRDKSWNAKSS